jgi:hypothetical protein
LLLDGRGGSGHNGRRGRWRIFAKVAQVFLDCISILFMLGDVAREVGGHVKGTSSEEAHVLSFTIHPEHVETVSEHLLT